jgi:HK97 family phage major capsid protein
MDFAQIQAELRKMTDELNTTFHQFREANDKRLEEVEARGAALAETEAKVDTINAAITDIREKMEELEKRASRPKIKLERRSGRPNEVLEITEEEAERREAFIQYCRRGTEEMAPEMRNALHSGSDGDGGFLAPPSFESEIIMNAYDMAEIRPLAQVGTTGRDTVLLGALSKPIVGWGRANLAVDPQKLNSGVRRITIYDLKALALIHNNTLEDADADIAGELNDAFSMAVAEAEDDAFVAGAGDDSPQGILADTSVQANYTPSGVAAALTDASNNGIDALISCFYSVKKVYRRNGAFFFNSTTEAVIRKIKDTNDGQYLWQPPVQAGNPPLLLGKAVINPEGCPDIAAGSFPIGFGDIRAGYKIRDRSGIVVRRLDERYADFDQTGFMIKKRVGGLVTLAEAFACVKIATT